MSKSAVLIVGVVVFLVAEVLAAFVFRDARKHRPSTTSPESSMAQEPVAAPASPPVAATASKQSPPSSPPPVTQPKLPPPIAQNTDTRLDEASLMSRLHDLAASDLPQSLALAREAVARFPDSPNAPEFEWNVVKALANMGRFPEAEEEARAMVRRFPGTAFSEDVERHVLNHPPNP
jgi:hypothetical protein